MISELRRWVHIRRRRESTEGGAVQLGYKLIAEGYGPREIVRQAVAAEEAGFDFVEASDHIHPWISETKHSGFLWSMLPAIAAKTSTIRMGPGVTCPTMRYHPAIIAQAAATTSLLSDGRFFLGLGSGERLNEHITGQGWPSVSVRQHMLREAIDIIRLLWRGGYRSYDGRYLSISDARVFDLPDTLPEIIVAAGGDRAATLAAEYGDGLFATEPRRDLVDTYTAAGGSGPTYAEVPLSYATSVDAAAESARATFRFGLVGWKVQSELPNPVNFDAATAFVTADDVAESFGCGPDPGQHLAAIQKFVDAGFDHLALVNAGPDPDAFFEFFATELAPKARELTPTGGSS